MPLYFYEALDSLGKKVSGAVDSQTLQEAKAKLREQGLLLIKISTRASVSKQENIGSDSLIAITMQLAQLIKAGVPLYQSLVTLEEQYRANAFHRVLASLCDQIKGGSSLSEAMRAFPKSFDALYVGMVAAGEASGSLDRVLKRLHLLLLKQKKLRTELATAMIYPAVLSCFMLGIIAVLVGYLVPSIEAVFAGRELNSLTLFVLSVSRFLREKWWIYLPLLGCSVTALILFLRKERGKRALQKLLMKVPILGKLLIETAIARFSRTMATLQQGGLTLIDSLRLSRKVIGNYALEEEFFRAEEKIIQGGTFSVELKRSLLVPPMVAQMLSIGEESGHLVEMLDNVAEIYEEGVEKTLTRVVALAQPVILILMGGVIGIVMLAILLPITDMASLNL